MKNKAIDIVAENAKTKMPGINKAAMMTSTPIAATLTSGSVAGHESSRSIAVHDSCLTFFFEHGIKSIKSLYFF